MIANLVADALIEFFGKVFWSGVTMARFYRPQDESAQDKGGRRI